MKGWARCVLFAELVFQDLSAVSKIWMFPAIFLCHILVFLSNPLPFR